MTPSFRFYYAVFFCLCIYLVLYSIFLYKTLGKYAVPVGVAALVLMIVQGIRIARHRRE